MQKNRIIGMLLISVGAILTLSSFSGITGFAITENLGKNTISILGLILIIGGALIFINKKGKMNSPKTLNDIVETTPLASTKNLEILPDTEFIKSALHHRGIKKSAIDMSGYQLVLLNKILQECKGKVPQGIINYLKSPYVTSKTENVQYLSKYKDIIKKAWEDSNVHSRFDESKNIFYGADGRLLAYAIKRGNKPTLILSDDTHLKKIYPQINEMMDTNIHVMGLRDYRANY